MRMETFPLDLNEMPATGYILAFQDAKGGYRGLAVDGAQYHADIHSAQDTHEKYLVGQDDDITHLRIYSLEEIKEKLGGL